MAMHAGATASILSVPRMRRHLRLVAKMRWRRRLLTKLHPKTRSAIGFGMLSGSLYYLLYHFNHDIRAIAEATNAGNKSLFLLPIAIAFLFSIVHGLFTDRFWDALGLKAKR